MNTYRERVQALIETLQACYDEAGVLRDYSDGESMKAPFNNARRLLVDVWSPLQSLDNRLPDDVAAMNTKGCGLVKESK
ncbi:MAG: hypothetical protein J0H07_10425 [Sphingobacteriales bacterium]|nr:hypothetical protein [Sphingobacteriales bacterium]